MEDNKLGADLSLALEVPEDMREQTLDLDTGYLEEVKRWELIIQYVGSLERVQEDLDLTIVPLFNQYAVITIPENQVVRLSEYEEIIYIEKPKRLYFAVSNGKAASCINPVQNTAAGQGNPFALSGAGVLLGVIDSGIDYMHPDFMKEDGTTRILALWDQTVPADRNREIRLQDGREVTPKPPEGYPLGTLYTQEMINAALAARRAAGGAAGPAGNAAALELVPSVDSGGHGTHVAGIAAGGGRASNGRYRGVAYGSELIIVKLGSSVGGSFPKTPQLMEAVDFCIRTAMELFRPAAINVSFGNNYGAHNGRSLVESYINDAADVWKNAIVIGTGNEGTLGRHRGGNLVMGSIENVEFILAQYESAFNLQLWKNYYDEFDIELISPGGYGTGVLRERETGAVFRLEGTEVLVYYGEPTPYNPLQEIYFEFIPAPGGNAYITPGIWLVRLTPVRIVTGRYDMWMPAGGVNQPDTSFLRPTEEITLTIPSTAYRALSVAAYDSNLDSYAFFSGRGFTRDNQVKPDIAAPGVDITSASPGGGYTERSGTSMATPFVSGSVALLMEWGIVRDNDRYLYGEKVKMYLIKGARHLPGFTEWPNPQIGWGVLCLRDSLPV